jgi:dolichol-phosphate mannosyltransferase
MLLLDKAVGRYVPVRFVMFASIGALGLAVHLMVLTAAYRLARVDFIAGQATATCAAMAFNYSLNNVLTYRDRRRRGRQWVTGLLSFMMACSVGALANVGVAAYLFSQQSEWLVAGIAGVLTGAVWNYAVTSAYTWNRIRH